MGLHLKVPPTILPDLAAREHRNRVWWTAYTFDRMWSAKLGFPPAISDNEMKVELPSNPHEQIDTADFPDRSYFVARITLAKLTSRTMNLIYGYDSQAKSLSERVQSAFRDLRAWMDELPESLKVDSSIPSKSDPRACSLQLLFNQVVFYAFPPLSSNHFLIDPTVTHPRNTPNSVARTQDPSIAATNRTGHPGIRPGAL